MYRLAFAARSLSQAVDTGFRASAESFRRVPVEEAKGANPLRISIVRVGLRDPASDKYVGEAEAWERADVPVLLDILAEDARFAMPNQGAAKAEVSVSVFDRPTGDRLSNVNRWRGQADLQPVASEKDVPAQPISVNGKEGAMFDFAGSGGDAKRVRVAMIYDGQQVWFFKLQGPAGAVAVVLGQVGAVGAVAAEGHLRQGEPGAFVEDAPAHCHRAVARVPVGGET